ncbi:MAG: hypothetical protein GWN56_15410 [Nitrosopumilaceae archaeon]|nr:hypothetical protein [Nitrosopumilaceae archaeon]NIV64864.1 hypothetical protein [Nitrosopumilaceae archaeon]
MKVRTAMTVTNALIMTFTMTWIAVSNFKYHSITLMTITSTVVVWWITS